ncbi:MAG: metallophosphoesterase [Clostridia bacterium]|nr:metallophosphoesterase [Clostridia bacterium]
METLEKEAVREEAKTGQKRGAQAKKRLKVCLILLLVLCALIALGAGVGALGNRSNMRKVEALSPVDYPEDRLVPDTDAFGNVSFVTDRTLKIVQLTDIHLGCGWMSLKKDAMALGCVAAMLAAEKPDLVIVTGDVGYPIPFQSGTLNNLTPAKMFAALMERLGVYWTLTLGNHDAESYSYYTREEIGAFYESGDYPHCLFRRGPTDVDGVGNQIVSVRNSEGAYTQLLYLFDSHDYRRDRALGWLTWKYDNIHENQVAWYARTLGEYEKANGAAVNSLAFFHIPLTEYRDAWYEFLDNGCRNTENVRYVYGAASDSHKVVYCGVGEDDLFETAIALGSTQGFFCGHDHYNTFSVEYRGVRLTYGKSVDYLAMPGIARVGGQRGCTVIEVNPDGSFGCRSESYYQDKYALDGKEDVKMQYDPAVYDAPGDPRGRTFGRAKRK